MADTTAAASGPDGSEETDGNEFGEPTPLSPIARAAWIAGSVVLVIVAFYLLAHTAFPRINPAQSAPSGHYPGSCAICHTVTASAPVRTKK